MKNYSELSRSERIDKVMSQRRADVSLVLEDLVEERNAAAIIRTAESFGISKIYIVQSANVKTRVSKGVSSGAVKWVEVTFLDSIEECIKVLKNDGFRVVGALVDPEAKQLWDADFSGKVAVVVGNEPHGLSEAAKQLVDENIYIPMYGLTESFNVSVSAAIFVYEIMRQKVADKNVDG
jgi:tRNA (guanosine-2'-O-)-methyltransferase